MDSPAEAGQAVQFILLEAEDTGFIACPDLSGLGLVPRPHETLCVLCTVFNIPKFLSGFSFVDACQSH